MIFDEIFIWTGDSTVFPAIIKSIEDKKNIRSDIKTAGVRCILFIEDTPRFYSSILPVLYKEIIQNAKQLIDKSIFKDIKEVNSHIEVIKKAKIELKDDIRTLELKNWLNHIKK